MLPTLPVREQLTDVRPTAVLHGMADLAEAAIAANIDLIDPRDVVLAASGRWTLGRSARNADLALDGPRGPHLAPEANRSGPTPATLVFSVGAIGAWVALGEMSPAPEDEHEHDRWLEALRERLEATWANQTEGPAAITWIVRCLGRDPFKRPLPRKVIAAPANRTPTLVVRTPIDPPLVQTLVAPPSPPRSEFPTSLALAAIVALGMSSCALGALVGRYWGLSAASPVLVTTPASYSPPPPAPIAAPLPPPPPAPLETPPVPAAPPKPKIARQPASAPAPAPATRPAPEPPAPEPPAPPAPPEPANPPRLDDLRSPWERR